VLINSRSSINAIGGISPGAGNLISGNAFGIQIDDAGGAVSNITIQGNLIGTDKSGAAAIPNNVGVLLPAVVPTQTVSQITIGGTTPGAGNVISGNGRSGIELYGYASDNLIAGNLIGTDLTGTVALGNGDGISISTGASNNIIGGTTTGARNVISG